MTSELSEEETQQYRSVFDLFDINGTGTIKTKELQAILSQSTNVHLSEEYLDKLLSTFESSNDDEDSIDFDEFINLITLAVQHSTSATSNTASSNSTANSNSNNTASNNTNNAATSNTSNNKPAAPQEAKDLHKVVDFFDDVVTLQSQFLTLASIGDEDDLSIIIHKLRQSLSGELNPSQIRVLVRLLYKHYIASREKASDDGLIAVRSIISQSAVADYFAERWGNPSLAGFFAEKSATEGMTSDEIIWELGLDYEGSPFIDPETGEIDKIVFIIEADMNINDGTLVPLDPRIRETIKGFIELYNTENPESPLHDHHHTGSNDNNNINNNNNNNNNSNNDIQKQAEEVFKRSYDVNWTVTSPHHTGAGFSITRCKSNPSLVSLVENSSSSFTSSTLSPSTTLSSSSSSSSNTSSAISPTIIKLTNQHVPMTHTLRSDWIPYPVGTVVLAQGTRRNELVKIAQWDGSIWNLFLSSRRIPPWLSRFLRPNKNPAELISDWKEAIYEEDEEEELDPKIKDVIFKHLKGGSVVHLKCKSTGKYLRVNKDGSVDGLGRRSRKATFIVHKGKYSTIVRLQNLYNRFNWLKIDNLGNLHAKGAGGPFVFFEVVKPDADDVDEEDDGDDNEDDDDDDDEDEDGADDGKASSDSEGESDDEEDEKKKKEEEEERESGLGTWFSLRSVVHERGGAAKYHWHVGIDKEGKPLKGQDTGTPKFEKFKVVPRV